jgi:hypothetical protein
VRSEISTARKRDSHPYDWCIDESWVAWQLFVALGRFAREKAAGEAIWDPSAGSGRTMATFVENGFTVFTSDIVNRIDPAQFDDDAAAGVLQRFLPADFLELAAAPARCSIVGNPPYSYVKGIAEAFVRQALRLSSRRVCMVLPLKWLASKGRFGLFMRDHPPQAVLVLTQRPSMPPGDMIGRMGNRAFRGGVIDYAWFVWDVTRPTAPGDSRIVWLPPLDRPDLQIAVEGLA